MDSLDFLNNVLATCFWSCMLLLLAYTYSRQANSVQSVVRPPDAGRDLNPARSPDRLSLSELKLMVENTWGTAERRDSKGHFSMGWDAACGEILQKLEELDEGEGSLERQDAVEKS